jgi:hypothetical protein
MSSDRLQWTGPDNFWPGYQLNLGQASGPRYEWKRLLRRDFACGVVLLNQPGTRRAYVTLPRGLTALSGTAVSFVVLGPSQAEILTRP